MRQPFANLEGLVRLSHDEGVDIRRPLLRVLTDLYVQEKSHTREEEQQFVELILRLLPAVDTATKIAVARKLVPYRLTPAAVIEALTRDTPAVAALVEAASTPAAAERTAAGAQASAPPVDPEPATLPPAQPRPSFGEAFLRAGPAERAAILGQLENAAAGTAGELPGAASRPEVAERLERAAMRRNQHEFARELQQALGISGRLAWRIVDDDGGEPLTVAAVALGVPMELFVRILLFLNPAIGESVERVFALARLREHLTTHAVAPIIAGWRQDTASRPAARFQPLHAPDAAPSVLAARERARGPREATEPVQRRPAATDQRQRHQGTT